MRVHDDPGHGLALRRGVGTLEVRLEPLQELLGQAALAHKIAQGRRTSWAKFRPLIVILSHSTAKSHDLGQLTFPDSALSVEASIGLT